MIIRSPADEAAPPSSEPAGASDRESTLVPLHVPADLQKKMLEFEGRIDWSSVVTAAIAEFIAKNKVLRDANDFGAAVDRLRASKRRHVETAAEYWKALGRRWAGLEAEYVQLLRLAGSYVRDVEMEGWPIFEDHLLTPGQQLCEIIEPGGNLHPDEVFGDQWTEIDRDIVGIKNFCDGVIEAFNALKEKI